MFKSEKAWEYMLSDEPTLGNKVLNFFRRSAREYSSLEGLSKEARRLARHYKKLFDKISVANKDNNAFGGVKFESAENKKTSEKTNTDVRYALPEALKKLGEYDATKIRHIESSGKDRVVRDYNEIIEFINHSKINPPFERLHIGIISDKTAELVKASTGEDIKGYDFVLASNFVFHIYNSHGNEAIEAPRGHKAVDDANIENIIEAVIDPDDVSLVSDSTGTALRFEKLLEGRNVAITITSTKKSTLTLKSAWIINEKSGGRTPSANANALAGTPEANSRSSTDNSITENAEKSNPSDENSLKNPPKERFALPESDSTGAELTNDQRKYFDASKQLDSEGRLQVMYQGAPEEFFTFDKKKSKASNLYGRGFYFTNSADQARHYGTVRGYYLNITNHLSATKKTISRMQMRKFLNAVAENEDYSIENYGTYDVAEVLRSVYEGKSDFAMLYDVSLTAIGDLVEAVELFNEVNGTEYDGFILDTESVIFRSEQAKLTSNKNPTADPDIRFALSDEAIANYTEKQYNSFGWVRANDVVTEGYWNNFNRNYAEAVYNKEFDRITSDGEYMIEIYDENLEERIQVIDHIVFAKGNIKSPNVSKIIQIYEVDETKLAKYRRNIYDFERRGIQQEASELLELHRKTDFGAYDKEDYGGKVFGYNKRFRAERGRDSSKTPRVKEYIFGENGEVIERRALTDEAYMEAVESGDTATQERIIEQRAREAGYNTPRLYHGTTSFGFTEFNHEASYDRISIFSSDNEDVAKIYAENDPRTKISKTGSNQKLCIS